MKYSFEIQLGKHYNALKAIHDTTLIIRQCGYTSFYLRGIRSTNKITRYLFTVIQAIRIWFKIKPDDICIMQWPLYTASDKLLYPVIKNKCKHLKILIHDLDSYRQRSGEKIEMQYLTIAEEIIVHTHNMQDYLLHIGISNSHIKVLTLFDYLISEEMLPSRRFSKEIVFAGNLTKSTFLEGLIRHPIGVPIFCYGKHSQPITPPLTYQGYFEPDDPSSILGSWGLVWEGTSANTCEGRLGEYLRINSPHKASLYIVARLPILIWKKAALAQYIEEKGLGLCISSLSDIPRLLSAITEDQYNQFLHNVDKEREELINGKHLSRLLTD